MQRVQDLTNSQNRQTWILLVGELSSIRTLSRQVSDYFQIIISALRAGAETQDLEGEEITEAKARTA